MSDDATLHRAAMEIAALKAIRARVGALRDDLAGDLRRDLVLLRRELAEHLPKLDAALQALVGQVASDRLVEYRTLFSRYRHALALHQANWPAVRINEDRQAYAASAEASRVVEAALIAWIEDVSRPCAGKH